jgi:hypothetical protein
MVHVHVASTARQLMRPAAERGTTARLRILRYTLVVPFGGPSCACLGHSAKCRGVAPMFWGSARVHRHKNGVAERTASEMVE